MKKNIIIHLLVAIVLMLSLFSCGRKASAPPRPSLRTFPRVEVPSMYESESDRMNYFVQRYWDRFTDTSEVFFCDSTTVNGVSLDGLEEAMGMYVTLLERTSEDVAEKSLSRLCDRLLAFEKKDTASNVMEEVLRLTEKYLYDPQSPVRDEDKFEVVASRFSEGNPRYSFIARMSSLNRVGTPATDFEFTDTKGRLRTLYSIKADYTLLIFGNPDCTACKNLTVAMSGDPRINSLISYGRLKVVDIYIDHEVDLWKSKVDEYPSVWVNGYDHKFKIREDLIYHVRAIPSMYLLDKSKIVLMKDAPENKLLQYLSSL